MSLLQDKTPEGGVRLTANPKDKNGELLSGLVLSVELKRPTHEGIDRKFSLKETGLGVYKGQSDKISLGKWYLFVTASRNKEVLYRTKNVLYLK